MNKWRLFSTLILPVFLTLLFSISFYFYIQSDYFENLYYSYQSGQIYSVLDDLEEAYNQQSGKVTSEELDDLGSNVGGLILLLDTDGQILMTSEKMSNTNTKVYRDGLDYLETWKTRRQLFESVVIGKEQAEINVREVISGVDTTVVIKPILDSETEDTLAVSMIIAPLTPIKVAIDFIRDQLGPFLFISTIIILIISILRYFQITNALNSVSSRIEENWGLLESPVGFKKGSFKDLRDQTSLFTQKLVEDNSKLHKQLELKEISEKEKAAFTGRVSHELKTPIALIRGYAEALRDRVRQDSRRDYYESVIIEESLRMETLLEDLLDLSRLETGSYVLNLLPFSVNSLLVEALAAFQPELNRKNVTIQLQNLESDTSVYADKNRIHQVLRNLLSNALKAVPEEGKLFLRIIAPTDCDHVEIEIENSGAGIPEEHINQIWEQFYTRRSQASDSDSDKRETGGIGLGLAIVRSILLLHDSRFGVRNTEIGVCFYFSLKKWDN